MQEDSQHQQNQPVMYVPVMRPEQWAKIQGMKLKTVLNQMDNGLIPFVCLDSPTMPDGTEKKRRLRWVNIAAMNEAALTA